MASSVIEETYDDSKLISRPPTWGEQISNSVFCWSTRAFGAFVVFLLLLIFLEIGRLAFPAIMERGLGFIFGTTWDPNRDVFGVLPEIWGTLYSSLLGVAIGTIFGLAVAIFLSERFVSQWLFKMLGRFGLQFHPVWGKIPDYVELVLKNIVQLLAAIPSVVYGLWGIFVVIPLIRPFCNWLNSGLDWIPFFSTPLSGKGILPAAIVLGIMVLPIITAISRDALAAVHPRIREAAYGLGATRWEAILGVIVPTALPGIFGSIILAFGRALGETMALAMLVGGANQISLSFFSPANTLAALLANNFGEAGPKEVGLLMYAALILLVISYAVNLLGAFVLQRATRKHGARR